MCVVTLAPTGKIRSAVLSSRLSMAFSPALAITARCAYLKTKVGSRFMIYFQGCREYGDFHGDSNGYGYGMGMGTVMNPHGPVGILWGFLIGNALNMR